MYKKINSMIPATKTPQERAIDGFSKNGEKKTSPTIIDKFKIQGVNAAAANRPTEFKIPANKETNETKSKKGNVIRDK